ncbi:MAG: hypothetical protein ACYSWU_15330 [Planctomycetota bacterium]|jgi:hypothetical protein
MEFQFICPRGHRLQGDESQTGQHCKCPYCESEFLVPQPSRDPRPDHLPVAHAETGGPAPAHDQPPPASEPAVGGESFPAIRTGPQAGGDPADVAAQLGFGDARQMDLLHIPCPNGHLLETPRDMLGQDAMCPHCRAQFRLQFEESQEYQREKAEQRERRERKLGKAWLHWAIATAVVVVLGVIFMVAFAVYR